MPEATDMSERTPLPLCAQASSTAAESRRTAWQATAPGKINVSLAVGPRREDGYHGLASLFLAVSLLETVELEGWPSAELSLALDPASDEALGLDGVPLDSRNLAHRAALLVAEAAGLTLDCPPDHDGAGRLAITKRVPIAGGMGGGSADAAAALVAANRALGEPLDRGRLFELAARLGADVPFALEGGAALGLGVGDQLTRVPVGAPLHWVLVPSQSGLSTPAVFARLDELREARGETVPEPDSVPGELLEALAAADPAALARHLRNDLQEAAFDLAPSLRETLQAGLDGGALAGLVSGSGPTMAFLAAGACEAESLRAALARGGHPRAVVVSGPVSGAVLTP